MIKYFTGVSCQIAEEIVEYVQTSFHSILYF